MQPDPEYVNEWQANLHARRLRERRLSFPAISVVMEDLYGVTRTGEQWRHELIRRQGLIHLRAPRGKPFDPRAVA